MSRRHPDATRLAGARVPATDDSPEGPRSAEAPAVETLLVVSHVMHRRWKGQLFAYTPYAREIEMWADLFPRVRIAAPCREEAPPEDASAINRANVEILAQRELHSRRSGGFLGWLAQVPGAAASLSKAMRQADAIHLRCPGNLGLLGCLLAPLHSDYLVAKYAGQWVRFPGEPWTWRLQRALLRSRFWRGPVTVYGNWPGQPSQVVPFFSAALDEEQMRQARVAVDRRGPLGSPLRLLFVGRLTPQKNVGILFQAMARLQEAGASLACTIVGDGPARPELQRDVARLGLEDQVKFEGARPFERVLEEYEKADVVVLASESEGWPKALTEAMAFGCLCIGSEAGLIPQILGQGRGLVVPAGDAPALASALRSILDDPRRFEAARKVAAEWAWRYSLENLREGIRSLLAASWGARLRPPLAPDPEKA